MNTIETKHSEGALAALIAMQAEQITAQNKIVHARAVLAVAKGGV